jgi:hypothetical protein
VPQAEVISKKELCFYSIRLTPPYSTVSTYSYRELLISPLHLHTPYSSTDMYVGMYRSNHPPQGAHGSWLMAHPVDDILTSTILTSTIFNPSYYTYSYCAAARKYALRSLAAPMPVPVRTKFFHHSRVSEYPFREDSSIACSSEGTLALSSLHLLAIHAEPEFRWE